jgi:hypothetical protein
MDVFGFNNFKINDNLSIMWRAICVLTVLTAASQGRDGSPAAREVTAEHLRSRSPPYSDNLISMVQLL